MTLQIATGFEAFASLQGEGLAQFAAPEDGRSVTRADAAGQLKNPALWLRQTMRDKPFEMIERALSVETSGALMLEFLTSMAVLAFRAKAASVRPAKAMYRVALVDYTPWRQADRLSRCYACSTCPPELWQCTILP